MKWLLFLVYLLLMPLVVNGYSVFFDVVVSGNDVFILGYKMLWSINGAGLVGFWQWIFNDDKD